MIHNHKELNLIVIKKMFIAARRMRMALSPSGNGAYAMQVQTPFGVLSARNFGTAA